MFVGLSKQDRHGCLRKKYRKRSTWGFVWGRSQIKRKITSAQLEGPNDMDSFVRFFRHIFLREIDFLDNALKDSWIFYQKKLGCALWFSRVQLCQVCDFLRRKTWKTPTQFVFWQKIRRPNPHPLTWTGILTSFNYFSVLVKSHWNPIEMAS